MKQNKLVPAIVIVAILVVAGCLIWQLHNSKIAGPAVEQKVAAILKTEFSLEFTNSWRTVNASGGLVGSPFYSIRWWREYFVQVQGDLSAFQSLSNDLASRHWTTAFNFLPPDNDFRAILPHPDSTNLASWWQPETNVEPMMSAQMGYGEDAVFIYSFQKATNALTYIHVIER